MKKKKYILGIGMLCTILAASFCLTHITHVAAQRAYRALDGVEIVLDAGHGGKDDGARANEVKEQVINLSIAKKLKKRLEESGAHVTMTRSGAYDLASANASNRKKEDMKKRVEIINAEKTDLFLSIHLNSYPNTSVKGAQAFYASDNEISKVFADMVQKHLRALTQTKMTSKPGDYYILNNTHKIGSLVECGFLSNAEDRAKLVDEEYQKKVAQTLYDSILEYFNFLS